MQRVSVQRPRRQPQGMRQVQNRNMEQSPALLMARRVNTEQGTQQLKAYLLAIEPFVAPNELRNISGSFGLDFDSIERPAKQSSAPEKSRKQGSPGMNAGNMGGMNTGNMGGMNMGNMGSMGGMNMGGNNQMQMLQMMMNMQKLMKGGGDISQIMKFMGGRR